MKQKAPAAAGSRFRGVAFDMDGTLTEPCIDFAAMRAALGIPTGDMLAVIRGWPPERQAWAFGVVERIEEQARRELRLRPGARELMAAMDALGLRRGLMTRNTPRSVACLLTVLPHRFDPVLTREDAAVKPDPAPVLRMCACWSLQPCEILVVGDHLDDLRCAHAAGARACLVRHAANGRHAAEADYAVDDLAQVIALLDPPP